MAGASRGRALHRHVGVVRVLRPHDSAQRAPVNGTPFSLRRRLWRGRGTCVVVRSQALFFSLCFNCQRSSTAARGRR